MKKPTSVTIPAIRLFLFMMAATGLAYPALVTIAAQAFFPREASGSLLIGPSGKIVGSALLAQKTESPRYFWPRPSSANYDALSSGGSNLGPTSANLQSISTKRLEFLKASNPAMTAVGRLPPPDLIFASGSGLDPEISPDAADYQIARVAQARRAPETAIRSLVKKYRLSRELGFLGEPRVNAFALNLALDRELPLPSPASASEPKESTQ